MYPLQMGICETDTQKHTKMVVEYSLPLSVFMLFHCKPHCFVWISLFFFYLHKGGSVFTLVCWFFAFFCKFVRNFDETWWSDVVRVQERTHSILARIWFTGKLHDLHLNLHVYSKGIIHWSWWKKKTQAHLGSWYLWMFQFGAAWLNLWRLLDLGNVVSQWKCRWFDSSLGSFCVL